MRRLCRPSVRDLMRVGAPTVADACERVMRGVVGRDGPPDGVTRTGTDGTGRGRHEVMAVVVGHDRDRVTWCGEGVGAEALGPLFEPVGEGRCAAVTPVSRDGASWTGAACGRWLPSATQAMGPFHAVRWVTGALDEVRRQALGEAREAHGRPPGGRRGRPARDDPDARARAVALARVREVGGTRWSLPRSPEDPTDGQGGTLDRVSKANGRLHRAHNLKEGFRDVFSLGPGEGVTERLLDVRLSRACRSRIPETVKVSRPIRKRRAEILAAVEHGLPNSRLEATNNKIKVAIRMGYGFTSFESLKAIVFLGCCGVRLSLPGRKPSGWRVMGSARRTRKSA